MPERVGGSEAAQRSYFCVRNPVACGGTGIGGGTTLNGFGGHIGEDGNYGFTLDPTTKQTPNTAICPPTEKCDTTEALIGAGLIIVADLIEVVALAAGFVVGGPVGAVEVLEATEPLLIPANIIGVALIFDSGIVRDFNRTAWRCKTWLECLQRLGG